MKQLLKTLVLMILLFSAHKLWGVVGCGYLTDNSTCGNYAGANPYAAHPGWPLAHTDISACGTINPSTNGYYLVTGNLSASPDDTALCLTFNWTSNTGWVLDLGKHTITGRILINSNTNGATILNGTINCTTYDPNACLKIVTAPSQTSGTPTRIEFLSISNSFTGAQQARSLYISSVASSTWTEAGYRYRFHNLTVNNPHTSVGYRSHGISIPTSGLSVQVDNNLLTCPADADQCWTADLFNIGTFSFDHNQVILNTHNAGLNYGEALNWEPGTTPPSPGNGLFEYNDITQNNNRGLRFWGACGGWNGLQVDNNIFRSINLDTAVKRWGAVSLGEAGCAYPQIFTNTEIRNNTFEIIQGQAVMVSGAQNVLVHDNTCSCPSGCTAGNNCAWANVAGANESPATMNFYSNTVTDYTTASVAPAVACGPAGNPAYVCAGGGLTTSTVMYCPASNLPVGNGMIMLDNALCLTSVPGISLAFSSMAFGVSSVGSTQSVILTNTGTAALAITSITASTGFNVTNDCGVSLAAESSCTLTVSLVHKGASQTGTVTLITNAASSPDVISLTASGISNSLQGNVVLGGSAVVH